MDVSGPAAAVRKHAEMIVNQALEAFMSAKRIWRDLMAARRVIWGKRFDLQVELSDMTCSRFRQIKLDQELFENDELLQDVGTEAAPVFELPQALARCLTKSATRRGVSSADVHWRQPRYVLAQKKSPVRSRESREEGRALPHTALALKAASGVGGVWSLSCVDVFGFKKSPNFQRLFGNKKPFLNQQPIENTESRPMGGA
jgi:hypothetical protein